MNWIQKQVYSTELDDSGGDLVYCIRSFATTLASACGAGLIRNCRVQMAQTVNIFTFDVGDIVYDHFSGTTVFNGGGLKYVMVTSIAPSGGLTQVCTINSIGVITLVVTTDCGGEL